MEWFEKLRFARKVKGFSLRIAGQRTGISNAYLCEIENGKILDPSYFKIIKLLNLYNLTHDDIGEKANV